MQPRPSAATPVACVPLRRTALDRQAGTAEAKLRLCRSQCNLRCRDLRSGRGNCRKQETHHESTKQAVLARRETRSRPFVHSTGSAGGNRSGIEMGSRCRAMGRSICPSSRFFRSWCSSFPRRRSL